MACSSEKQTWWPANDVSRKRGVMKRERDCVSAIPVEREREKAKQVRALEDLNNLNRF